MEKVKRREERRRMYLGPIYWIMDHSGLWLLGGDGQKEGGENRKRE